MHISRTGLAAGIIGLLGVALAGKVLAGTRSYPLVTVDTTNRTASGALGTARRLFGQQFIACEVEGTNLDVHCEAQDFGGTYIDCVLDGAFDPRAATTVGSINPDSFVEFKWDTVAGDRVCTFIQVRNSSRYEPKAF